MTRKFVINADYGNGSMGPTTIYIGESEEGHHPIHFQADILSKNKGITITSDVMDALAELKEIATKNQVLLEDLAVYAIGTNDGTEQENNMAPETIEKINNILQEGEEQKISDGVVDNQKDHADYTDAGADDVDNGSGSTYTDAGADDVDNGSGSTYTDAGTDDVDNGSGSIANETDVKDNNKDKE